MSFFVVPEEDLLTARSNLASTYQSLGMHEQALRMKRDVYSGRLELHGEEQPQTLLSANNYAYCLLTLKRFEEAKTLLRRTIPVARRVLGESHELMFKIRTIYAEAHYMNTDATLDDLREAVTTLEDAGRIARRVFGGANPLTGGIEYHLRKSRFVLRVRETPPGPR